jgi:hypothetical protein
VKLLPRINAQLEAMQKRGELRAVLQSFETDPRIDPTTPEEGGRTVMRWRAAWAMHSHANIRIEP